LPTKKLNCSRNRSSKSPRDRLLATCDETNDSDICRLTTSTNCQLFYCSNKYIWVGERVPGHQIKPNNAPSIRINHNSWEQRASTSAQVKTSQYKRFRLSTHACALQQEAVLQGCKGNPKDAVAAQSKTALPQPDRCNCGHAFGGRAVAHNDFKVLRWAINERRIHGA
jgi:hypothetical protein